MNGRLIVFENEICWRACELKIISVDQAIVDGNVDQICMPTKYLNSLAPPGMPLHNLRLKKGTIVMLMSNLDIHNGLCNGT
ncbi:unnamed protein product [Nippostrongylus brasiliensis]|uniref:ATP-dependent DNA helicase n=1 Tax=Nippostrongylus brasiliensis TaxID=27835 RepID=A0A0N4YW61_NIPBR|nr:unnamed protein product [Nippostrongylus brasiliensis]